MVARKKKTQRKKALKRKQTATKRSKKRKGKIAKPIRKAARSSKKPKQIVIGVVTHYFPHVNAAVVKVKRPLSVGDRVKFKGHTTSFDQTIESMQIDHVPIQQAKKGDEIGLQVKERVREHDLVLPKD
jgi:putative protease